MIRKAIAIANQTVSQITSPIYYRVALGLLLLLPLPSLAQARPASGQDCGLTLSGKVTDHDQREPLQGAVVYIEELQLSTATDAFGNYHFHHLCEGTYRVRSRYLGYDVLTADIRVRSSTVRDFKMHPNPLQLQGVEITGTRLPPPPTQATARLSGRELEQTRTQSLGEALKRIPGLSSIQTGPTISKPVIHGLHSNRILILNNGVRQEGQQWGTEHAPEIDPMVADQMTVVKGAAAVRYGSDAVGGVVLVEPAPLRDSAGLGADLHLGGATNNRLGLLSARLDGNLARVPALSWRLQGTLRRAGNSRAPAYYLKNTGFSEHNFSGAVGYKRERYGVEAYYSQFNSALGILSAAHIGNLTDLNRAIDSPMPLEMDGFTYRIDRPYQEVRHDLLKANAFFRTGEYGKLQLIYAHQRNARGEYDKHVPRGRVPTDQDPPELFYQITTNTAELLWDHRVAPSFSGTVGLSGIEQQNTYAGRFFIPFYRHFGGGAFAIERWRRDKLQLEAGLRCDYRFFRPSLFENRELVRPEFHYRNFSGTVGARYDLGHHVTLSANAGTAWRAPGPNELFSDGVHHGAVAVERGDPSLRSETAYNLIATAEYHSSPHFTGEVTLYYKYIDNFIYLTPVPPAVLTIRGAFPFFAYRQTNAVFRGLDASGAYAFSPVVSVQGKVSLVRAFNQTIQDHLILIPPDRFEGSLRLDLPDPGPGAKPRDTFVAMGGRYVARQRRVPAEEDYAPAPPGYFLLVAEAGTSLRLRGQPVQVSLQGLNLLNTAYRDYLNRFRYFADESGRNIMVNLRIPLTLFRPKGP
jgi:iron complex outermembrane recepter protein